MDDERRYKLEQERDDDREREEEDGWENCEECGCDPCECEETKIGEEEDPPPTNTHVHPFIAQILDEHRLLPPTAKPDQIQKLWNDVENR